MRPYYDEGGVTIYCANNADVDLPRDGAIVSDPPYGIAHPTNYAERGRGNSPQFPNVSARNYPPVYGDDKPFDPSPWLTWPEVVLWGANHYANRLPIGGWLVWDKLRPEGIDQADAECAWVKRKFPVRVFRHLWNGMMRASERDSLEHPTQKPVALMRWCLGFVGADRIVLDPFMGSGTTLVAARQLGRRAIGIEIEEKYCEIAARRLAQAALPLWEEK